MWLKIHVQKEELRWWRSKGTLSLPCPSNTARLLSNHSEHPRNQLVIWENKNCKSTSRKVTTFWKCASRGRGALWCKRLQPALGGAVLLPEGFQCWWEGWIERDMVALCSPAPELEVWGPPLLSEPTQNNQSPYLCPWFPPETCIHSAYVWVFFSQLRDWVSKVQILGFLQHGRALFLWGRVSLGFCHFLAGPRKVVTRPHSGSVYSQAEQKAGTKTRGSEPASWGHSRRLAPPVLVTQRILSPCCDSWDSALLHHLSALKPGSFPMVADF